MLSLCGILAIFTISSPRYKELILSLDEEIILEVGEQKYVFYSVSPVNVQVFFSIDNPLVATIDNKTGIVYGVSSGITTLTAIAEYNGKVLTAHTSINVIPKTEEPTPPPYEPKYTIRLTDITNASFANDTLTIDNSYISFMIEVLDENNQLVTSDITIIPSVGISVTKEFNVYILDVSQSGVINIIDNINNINYTVKLEKVEKS